jgi:hypothetical protein
MAAGLHFKGDKTAQERLAEHGGGWLIKQLLPKRDQIRSTHGGEIGDIASFDHDSSPVPTVR